MRSDHGAWNTEDFARFARRQGYISGAESLDHMYHNPNSADDLAWLGKSVVHSHIPAMLAAVNDKPGESSSSSGGGIHINVHINVQDSQKEGGGKAPEAPREKSGGGGGGLGNLLGGILKVPEEILGGVASLI